ncbi:unnamed protein product [Caretta caretta]
MEGLVVNLINVYSPTSGPERQHFYQQASTVLSTLDPRECLFLGGDFNTNLEEQDNLGTEQCLAATDILQEIVDHHSLVVVWRNHHPDDISTFTLVRVEACQGSFPTLNSTEMDRSSHFFYACRVLWDELPMVSVGDRDRLELPLTLAEFSETLHRMPTNKSPGMDGLTVEFYPVFWDILGPDLVTIWAESLQSRVLPLSCSMNYKVIAKAILLWLGSMLADMVHPDQTYTIQGHTIFATCI